MARKFRGGSGRIMEDAQVEGVSVFKCRNNGNVTPHDSLFIFMSRSTTFKDTSIEQSRRQCVAISMGLFEDSIDGVVQMADLFMYQVTFRNIALELSLYLRSRFFLKETLDYSFVFVVDVGSAYASEKFVLAKERLLLLDSISAQTGTNTSCSDDDDTMLVDDCCESYVDELCDIGDCINNDYEDFLEDKEYMNDIIRQVKIWQGVASKPVLEEVKPMMRIEKLQWGRMGNDVVIAKKEEKHGECSICLASFPGKVPRNTRFQWLPASHSLELVRLGCGHAFHHRCIFRWLDKHGTCPMCRAPTFVVV